MTTLATDQTISTADQLSADAIAQGRTASDQKRQGEIAQAMATVPDTEVPQSDFDAYAKGLVLDANVGNAHERAIRVAGLAMPAAEVQKQIAATADDAIPQSASPAAQGMQDQNVA